MRHSPSSSIRLWLLIASVIASALVASAQQPELEAIQAASRKMLRMKNWAGLEKMAADLRDGKKRSDSGLWLLPSFYNGLGATDPKAQERRSPP